MSTVTTKHILIVWESSGDEIHLAVLEAWRLKHIQKLIDLYLIDKDYQVEARLVQYVQKNTIVDYLCQSYVLENSEELSKFNITKIMHLPPMAF